MMKNLTTEQLQILENIKSGRYNEVEFLFQSISNFDTIKEILNDSLIPISNLDDYNNAFHTIYWHIYNTVSSKSFITLCKLFLLTEGHNEHEEIVDSFQVLFNDDVSNIPVLENAINKIPAYLEQDDFKYPYIRKIIYSIGAQPEPYNIQSLEKIANTTLDQQIKELALHQIEKRRKLGRWEAAKNGQ